MLFWQGISTSSRDSSMCINMPFVFGWGWFQDFLFWDQEGEMTMNLCRPSKILNSDFDHIRLANHSTSYCNCSMQSHQNRASGVKWQPSSCGQFDARTYAVSSCWGCAMIWALRMNRGRRKWVDWCSEHAVIRIELVLLPRLNVVILYSYIYIYIILCPIAVGTAKCCHCSEMWILWSAVPVPRVFVFTTVDVPSDITGCIWTAEGSGRPATLSLQAAG